MRWIRLTILSLLSFWIVTGGAIFKQAAILFLGSIFALNFAVGSAPPAGNMQAVAAIPVEQTVIQPAELSSFQLPDQDQIQIAQAGGLPIRSLNQLPAEARTTVYLIQQGGPFPYDRDGLEFQNREGLLPQQPRGYYREYTVKTPGESDRGVRRIVAGQNGELYYTGDHYDSFVQIQN